MPGCQCGDASDAPLDTGGSVISTPPWPSSEAIVEFIGLPEYQNQWYEAAIQRMALGDGPKALEALERAWLNASMWLFLPISIPRSGRCAATHDSGG